MGLKNGTHWIPLMTIAPTRPAKRLALAPDIAITQPAFYSGARGVLKVLAHLIEQGEYEELHETTRRTDG